MDTDGLVLKYQAISIYSADQISIALGQFQTKNMLSGTILQKITCWKFFLKIPVI